MTKVSYIWRMVCIFLIGLIIGIFISFRYIKNSIPKGQLVEIGKIKIKGNNNDTNTQIVITNEDTVIPVKKKRRRRK